MKHFKSLHSKRLKTNAKQHIFQHETEVANQIYPMLIGPESSGKYSLAPENVANLLASKETWTIPIAKKHGHLYLKRVRVKCYIQNGNGKNYIYNFHFSTDKLFNLGAREKPENSNKETKEILKMITEADTT